MNTQSRNRIKENRTGGEERWANIVKERQRTGGRETREEEAESDLD